VLIDMGSFGRLCLNSFRRLSFRVNVILYCDCGGSGGGRRVKVKVNEGGVFVFSLEIVGRNKNE